jgi:hypothetical protein
MAKLSLIADPTFSASAPIPVPGSDPVPVSFTFKHRTRDELKTFVKDEAPNLADVDLLQAIATGWELDEAYTPENIAIFCQHRHAASAEIWRTYLRELTQARLGN